MKHSITSVLFTIFSISSVFSVSPNSKYTFEYNLKKGEKFVQYMTMQMKVSQSVMGQTMDVATDMKTKTSYKVTNVQNGIYSMEFIYDDMDIDMDMGFSKMNLSSKTADSIATLTNLNPMIKAMTGISLGISFDKKGKVTTVTGTEKIPQAMLQAMESSLNSQVRQQIIDQFSQQLSAETVKSSFEQSSSFFPQNPVSVGETWTTETTVNTQIAMTMKLNSTLISVENNIATLESVGEFTTGTTPVIQNMDGTEVKMTMKGSQTGKIKVDLRNGWVIASDITQNIESEVETNGMKVPQKITTKVVLRDKP